MAFQTKPQIALDQIKRAQQRSVPAGIVLADAGYGNDTQFRTRLTEWELPYVAGVQSAVSVWKPGQQPKTAPGRKEPGRPPKLLQRDAQHQPVSAKALALSLTAEAWKNVSWRQGVKNKAHFRVRRPSCPARSPGLLARRTAPGRMAPHRMAVRGEGTHKILVLHAAG